MITAADIRAARARLRENQEQFASRLGISRSKLVQWEKDAPRSIIDQNGLAHILAGLDAYEQEPVK